MKNKRAARQIKEQFLDNLSDEDFALFLTSGFIIQNPMGEELWLGIDLIDDPLGSFICHSFYNEQFKRYAPAILVKTNKTQLEHRCALFFKTKLALRPASNADDEFKLDLKKILNWFDLDSNLKKLVAVTTSTYDLKEDIHPLSQLSSMFKLEGSVYGVWENGKGVIGVSPEPLFMKMQNAKTDGKVSWMTRSLAGTIATKISNYEQQLLNDPKEINEHELVIKDIQEKLLPFVSDIIIGKTTVVPFGKIAHLQTDIYFSAHYLSAGKLVQILGPTAALGGFPQDLSQMYLRRLNYYHFEKENRQFGGTIAFEYEDDAFALVGIRNLYWDSKDQKAVIHSGGGIVKESIVENEIGEVRNKREVISSIFNG